MSIRLALTMRVVETAAYPERRDALAQDWSTFLAAALPGCAWMAMPNCGGAAAEMAQIFGIDGLILTGGDDWGTHPCRDSTESALLTWALEKGVPTLGICRGAQGINLHFGGAVRSSGNTLHCATRHRVAWSAGNTQQGWAEVNSYHNQVIAADGLAAALSSLAVAEDGSIEAFTLSGRPVLGLMWHPEREPLPRPHDLDLLQQLFCKENP